MNIAISETDSKQGEALSKKYLNAHYTLKKFKGWRDVFEAVNAGKAEQAIVPIYDSLKGTFYEVYDLFYKYNDIFVNSEVVLQIRDNEYRRFFIISKKQNSPKGNNKCSMIFVVSHKPGSLYGALAVFENYELNLTKIESRRMYGKKFEYIFYVDFEFGKDHASKIDEIIAVYKENTQYLRVIGYYKTL